MVRRYKVGEISRFFGISRDTVHYYDTFGILPASRDETNNYRSYSREDVVFFHHVSMLRELGVPLEEIKVSISDNSISIQHDMVESRKAKIKQEIAQLQQQLERACDYETAIARIEAGLLQPSILENLTVVYCEPDYKGTLTYKDIVESFHAIDPSRIPIFAFVAYQDWFSTDTIKEFYQYSQDMLDLRQQDLFQVNENGLFQRASMCIVTDHIPEEPLPPGFKIVTAPRWLQLSISNKTNEDYSELLFFLDWVLQHHYEAAGDCFIRAVNMRNRPKDNTDYYDVLFPIKETEE